MASATKRALELLQMLHSFYLRGLNEFNLNLYSPPPPPYINIIKKPLWLGFKTAAQIDTLQCKIQGKDFTGCCWKNEVKIPQTDKMRPPLWRNMVLLLKKAFVSPKLSFEFFLFVFPKHGRNTSDFIKLRTQYIRFGKRKQKELCVHANGSNRFGHKILPHFPHVCWQADSQEFLTDGSHWSLHHRHI